MKNRPIEELQHAAMPPCPECGHHLERTAGGNWSICPNCQGKLYPASWSPTLNEALALERERQRRDAEPDR